MKRVPLAVVLLGLFAAAPAMSEENWRIEAYGGKGRSDIAVNSALFGNMNGYSLSLGDEKNHTTAYGVGIDRRLDASTWIGLGVGLRLYETFGTTTLYGSTDDADSLHFQSVRFDGWNGDLQFSFAKERVVAHCVALLVGGRLGVGLDSFKILRRSGFPSGPPVERDRSETSGTRSFSACLGLAYKPVAVRYVYTLAGGSGQGARAAVSAVEFVARI